MQSGGKPYLKKEQRPPVSYWGRKGSSFDDASNSVRREMIVTLPFVKITGNKIRLIDCNEY